MQRPKSNMKMSKIASETDCNSHRTDQKIRIIIQTQLSVFVVISTFSHQISVVTKHEKIILFIDVDAEFHVLKLLFEVF